MPDLQLLLRRSSINVVVDCDGLTRPCPPRSKAPLCHLTTLRTINPSVHPSHHTNLNGVLSSGIHRRLLTNRSRQCQVHAYLVPRPEFNSSPFCPPSAPLLTPASARVIRCGAQGGPLTHPRLHVETSSPPSSSAARAVTSLAGYNGDAKPFAIVKVDSGTPSNSRRGVLPITSRPSCRACERWQ